MVGCAIRMYVKGEFDSKQVCLSRFPAILSRKTIISPFEVFENDWNSTEVFENVYIFTLWNKPIISS